MGAAESDTEEKTLEAKDEEAEAEKASDIPDEEVDAPLWFIEQKDDGYCVFEQDSKTEVGCHEFLEGAEAQVYELVDALKSLVEATKSDEEEVEEKSEKVELSPDEYKELMAIINDEA